MNDVEKSKINLFQKEYSESLQSARHHDNLVWIAVPILLGSLFLGLKDELQAIQLIIGFIITLFVIYIVRDFRRIKNHEYDRAKKILKEMRKLIDDKRDKDPLSQRDEDLLFERPKRGCQWVVFIIVSIIIWAIIFASRHNLCLK